MRTRLTIGLAAAAVIAVAISLAPTPKAEATVGQTIECSLGQTCITTHPATAACNPGLDRKAKIRLKLVDGWVNGTEAEAFQFQTIGERTIHSTGNTKTKTAYIRVETESYATVLAMWVGNQGQSGVLTQNFAVDGGFWGWHVRGVLYVSPCQWRGQ